MGNKCFQTVCWILFVALWITWSCATPCHRKSFGGTSFVCVCNATSCDTVDQETRPPDNHFLVYSTSKHGDRLNKSIFSFAKPSEAALKLYVDLYKTKQTILGFGGTFTDAAGINIASLPDGAQKHFIDSYFGPMGIEYTLGRIPIASNDMSVDVYSYDFTPGDMYLSKFTIDGNDHLYKIPYIDRAVSASRHNVSLYGSPWAPPEWMKTNGNMAGYGVVADGMYKVYANYLARFLSEYEGFMLKGRMWGLTTQSGPIRSCSNTSEPVYQSLCWTAETMRDWIVTNLTQSITDQGYGHIKLFTMDDNRDVLIHWSETFSDSEVEDEIDGFAVQGYHDDVTSPTSLCDVYNKYSGNKTLLGSEFCIRDVPVVALGSWERGEILARRIFDDLKNCMSGFTDYNLAVDVMGGPSWVNNTADSPIIVDKDKKVFYKQPMFYTMGHFSKFLPPGSIAIDVKVVGLSASEDDNPAVAFRRPDGSVTVVVGNFVSKSTVIEIKPMDSKLVVKYTMEENSINTFIWWK